MGKKKRDKKTLKNVKSKRIVPIEFETEFPIEILRLVSEFLPMQVLFQSVLTVCKESLKFTFEILKSRREKNMSDFKTPKLMVEYKFSKNSIYTTHSLLDKESKRVALSYQFKDTSVVAVVDLQSESRTSHIFESRNKNDHLNFCVMENPDKILLYSKDYFEIHSIKENRLLHKIKVLKVDQNFEFKDNMVYISEYITKLLYCNGLIILTFHSIYPETVIFSYLDDKLEFYDHKINSLVHYIYPTENPYQFLVLNKYLLAPSDYGIDIKRKAYLPVDQLGEVDYTKNYVDTSRIQTLNMKNLSLIQEYFLLGYDEENTSLKLYQFFTK